MSECKYQQPLIAEESQLPFINAAHVQSTKGTGLVHTAPAHGPDDFLICLERKIPIVSIIYTYHRMSGKLLQDVVRFIFYSRNLSLVMMEHIMMMHRLI